MMHLRLACLSLGRILLLVNNGLVRCQAEHVEFYCRQRFAVANVLLSLTCWAGHNIAAQIQNDRPCFSLSLIIPDTSSFCPSAARWLSAFCRLTRDKASIFSRSAALRYDPARWRFGCRALASVHTGRLAALFIRRRPWCRHGAMRRRGGGKSSHPGHFSYSAATRCAGMSVE